MLIFHGNICEYDLIGSYSSSSSICTEAGEFFLALQMLNKLPSFKAFAYKVELTHEKLLFRVLT
jgi:hypothetical protein